VNQRVEERGTNRERERDMRKTGEGEDARDREI
jgi:hypothetical protein